MRMTDNIFRVGIYPKKDEFFRIQGRKDGQLFYITSDKFVIGSAADADIVISGPAVAGRHLNVVVKDRELWLQNDAPLNHTLVSGRALTSQEEFHYKPNEVIQIGQVELLITIELFSRYLDPKLEADIIVREAEEKAAKIEQQLRLVKKEMKTTVEQAQRETAVLESKTRVEAETLLTTAQRQIEEKNRQAIEDAHARAEAIEQQAKVQAAAVIKQGEEQARKTVSDHDEQAKKIVERAKAAAAELVVSAKNEVDVLLKQGRGNALLIGQEAEERKKEALQFVHDLQAEMGKLIEDKDRFEAETSLSKQICSEALQKKQVALQQTHETESEYLRVRGRLDEFKEAMKKTEDEQNAKLRAFNEKCAEVEGQTEKSLQLRKEAEKIAAELHTQSADLEKSIGELNTQRGLFQTEITELEKNKTKMSHEIAELTKTYRADLALLREKVDAEYQRQLKVHVDHFQQLRDQESAVIEHRQKSMVKLEARYVRQQITQTQERMYKLITDRAALYGAPALAGSVEFKNDATDLVAKAMTEEFDSRRREMLATLPPPESLLQKRKWTRHLRTYGGWVLFVCTLGLLAMSQLNSGGVAERQPASRKEANGSSTIGSGGATNSNTAGSQSRTTDMH